GSDRQYVVALDKKNGKTVWQKNRSIDFDDLDSDGKPSSEGDLRKAFATCQVAVFEGRTMLLSQGSRALYAYEPTSGEELWRLEDRSNYAGSTRPVTGDGLIFVPSGFPSGEVLAIRPGQTGEYLDAKTNGPTGMRLNVAWKTKQRAPKKPSLVLQDGL